VRAEAPVAVAATGVWVRTGLPGPGVWVHAQVGAGTDELEAERVTRLPAVTVWVWIGLMVGGGDACTVMVVLAVATPHTFDVTKLRK